MRPQRALWPHLIFRQPRRRRSPLIHRGRSCSGVEAPFRDPFAANTSAPELLVPFGGRVTTAIVHARGRSSRVFVHQLSVSGAMLVAAEPLARGEVIAMALERLTLMARVASVEQMADGRHVAVIELRDL